MEVVLSENRDHVHSVVMDHVTHVRGKVVHHHSFSIYLRMLLNISVKTIKQQKAESIKTQPFLFGEKQIRKKGNDVSTIPQSLRREGDSQYIYLIG